jgi:2-aminoadipate transaminase
LKNGFNCSVFTTVPYRELRFAGEQLPPVAKFLPEQTVLVGSFSKIFSPGMRLGWLCMPKPMVRHFTVAKQATDLHTNVFCQYLLAQYLQTNDLEAHIAAIRARYKQQRDTMVSAIERYCPPQVTCTKPEGGMFLWMTLPEGVSSQELFARAIREQVAFVPGIPFFTDGSGDRYLRLNFSNADPAMIDEGMRRLGRAIKLMLEETTAGE